MALVLIVMVMGLLIGLTAGLIVTSIESYKQGVENKKRLKAFKDASMYMYVPTILEYEDEPEIIKINTEHIDPPIRRST